MEGKRQGLCNPGWQSAYFQECHPGRINQEIYFFLAGDFFAPDLVLAADFAVDFFFSATEFHLRVGVARHTSLRRNQCSTAGWTTALLPGDGVLAEAGL
jgi:hypothetical protein